MSIYSVEQNSLLPLFSRFFRAVHRNCGVHNPSWFELWQFVNFLNHQLLDCEQSVYCNPEFTGDTLEGFRIFVVRFMIIMSKVRVTVVFFT